MSLFEHDQYRLSRTREQAEVPAGFQRVHGREAERIIELAFATPQARQRLLALYREQQPHAAAQYRLERRDLLRARAWLLKLVSAESTGLLVLRRYVPPPAELPDLPELPRPPAPPPAPSTADWIEIELLDQDGEPFVGTPYSIAKGDDVVSQGGLNRFGSAYVDRIDPGQYKIVIGRTAEEEPLADTDWLVVELVHENGLAAAGERFVLTDAAGATHEGVLDAHGRVMLFDVAPGECTVAFPGLAEAEP